MPEENTVLAKIEMIAECTSREMIKKRIPARAAQLYFKTKDGKRFSTYVSLKNKWCKSLVSNPKLIENGIFVEILLGKDDSVKQWKILDKEQSNA